MALGTVKRPLTLRAALEHISRGVCSIIYATQCISCMIFIHKKEGLAPTLAFILNFMALHKSASLNSLHHFKNMDTAKYCRPCVDDPPCETAGHITHPQWSAEFISTLSLSRVRSTSRQPRTAHLCSAVQPHTSFVSRRQPLYQK